MATTRDALFDHVSYSCQQGECHRCSCPPGKQITRQPGNGMRGGRAFDLAPACTHECHNPPVGIIADIEVAY